MKQALRLAGWAMCLGTIGLLGGCAGQRAYDQGKTLLAGGDVSGGLAMLEQAVRLQPSNAEFRIGLSLQRTAAIQRLLTAAEIARRDQRATDSDALYRQVLALEPLNQMAQQGLAALAATARAGALLAEAQRLYKARGVAEAGAVLDRLRAVLAEEPRNRAALELRDLVEHERQRVARTDSALAESFRQPITLQFNDAPLKTIFDAISRISGLNFFFDKDIRPEARGTILARSTTVEDAVRVLLATNQLEQKVLNDNSILIYPNTAQKQKDYQALVVRAFFIANADAKAIGNTIKTIVKTRDVVVDERLGIVTMRDTPEAVRIAERIVALNDMNDPEVMLEVEVLEIKRSKLQELGLQWPGQLVLSPLPASGASTTTLADIRHLRSTTIGATLSSAAIHANQTDQDANILTNPKIRVRNKEKAKILIGDRIPVITTTTSGTASFVSESVSYLEVGLKLEVEPQIYLDDEVAIKMNLEVSNLVREVVSRSGTLSYQIGTRGATTVLRLKDGETQVLAGLISEEDRRSGNKIPGLGDLPMLGRLFGSQRDDDQRSEILLSITPRVLRSLTRPDLASAEFESGTETTVGAPPLRLQKLNAAATPPAAAGTSPPPEALPLVPSATVPRALSAPPAPAADPGAAAGNRPASGFAPAPPVFGNAPQLTWRGPAQVRQGQSFSLVLRAANVRDWRQLAVDLRFDPALLAFEEARPGAYFDPADGGGSLLQQGEPQSGVLRLQLSRQDSVPEPGSLADALPSPPLDTVVLTFKALQAGAAAVRLHRVDIQPAPPAPAVPVDHLLKVAP